MVPFTLCKSKNPIDAISTINQPVICDPYCSILATNFDRLLLDQSAVLTVLLLHTGMIAKLLSHGTNLSHNLSGHLHHRHAFF
jgi:hypothetical protein